MKVPVLVLANEATVQSGLLYVNGGGWEFVNAPRLPCQARGFIAGVVELEIAELGRASVLRAEIIDGLGQGAGFQGSMIVDAMRTEVPEIGFARVAFAVPFTAALQQADVYVARVLTEDGVELAAVPFSVMLPRPVDEET